MGEGEDNPCGRYYNGIECTTSSAGAICPPCQRIAMLRGIVMAGVVLRDDLRNRNIALGQQLAEAVKAREEESRARAELRCPADTFTELKAIRDAGWVVAIHNDYHLSGERMTFWLFTRNGREVHGEGINDLSALTRCREEIARQSNTGRCRASDLKTGQSCILPEHDGYTSHVLAAARQGDGEGEKK